jgi:preprotein translocase subunit SecA
MSKFNIEFKESVKTGGNRLGQLIENPFKNFAASKMSLGRKTMCVVEYTDLMNKTHRIVCNNRKQMLEAQTFLSIFKKESATIKGIISEYPVVMGRIPKRFLTELRSELKNYGLSYSFINRLAGY